MARARRQPAGRHAGRAGRCGGQQGGTRAGQGGAAANRAARRPAGRRAGRAGRRGGQQGGAWAGQGGVAARAVQRAASRAARRAGLGGALPAGRCDGQRAASRAARRAGQGGARLMKLKQLESLLGDVQQFDNPKIELEQYPTGPHIASRMLYEIHTRFDDMEGRTVLDLGCGCGTLGIAAAMLGAEYVVGVDADDSAIATAQANCQEYEIDMDFIQAKLPHLSLTS
ncbi:unnamed protein product [Closterium sp. NIES-53]